MFGWKRESETQAGDAGRLLLRLTIGGLLLLYGIDKVRSGPGVVQGMLHDAGLPGVLAYGVYVGEVVAPLLLIVGFYTRVASALIVINMAIAIGLAHAGEVFSLTQYGGWAIELQMLYLLGAVCIALLGPGRYAIGAKTGWRA
ncbi:DoxX [Pirellulimonas nuda]|uniref:DoxX n=1 Tax=Pirellulimonas nuda TaxID=2528009 RepID=A0A518DHN2_9BACT|nr:DoxX family protein [Pirellulimonas nuda]QDU90985.1 DoxX [Pirellulimonas nuda]